MKGRASSNKLIGTISKNINNQNDVIKIGFDTDKIIYSKQRKSFYSSFVAVAILIVLFALGGFIFEFMNWIYIYPSMNADKAANFSTKLDRGVLKQRKDLNLVTSNKRSGFSQSNAKERINLTSYTPSDGITHTTDRSTILSLDVLLATLGTNHKLSTQQFLGTTAKFTSLDSNQEEKKFCSDIIISSTDRVHELYPKLFGDYKPVGILSDRLVYKQRNTESFLFYSLNRKKWYRMETGSYENINDEIDWVLDLYPINKTYKGNLCLINKDYVAFKVDCEDLTTLTKSNCVPGWGLSYFNYSNDYRDGIHRRNYSTRLDRFSRRIGETITFKCKHGNEMANVFLNLEDMNGLLNNNSLVAETEIERDSICEEFELSSKNRIAKMLPPVMGTYSLVSYRYNDKFVYFNEEKGVYLYFNNKTKEFRGTWTIGYVLGSSEVLAFHPYCYDADFPANSLCEFGWVYMARQGPLQPATSLICRVPRHVAHNKTTTSVCRKLELTSNKAFEDESLTSFLGEYEITNASYNEKVVYHKLDLIMFKSRLLYFYKNVYNAKGWMIGANLGSRKGFIFNSYCKFLDNPENGECNAGWFYGNSETWVYDSSMAIKCTEILG